MKKIKSIIGVVITLILIITASHIYSVNAASTSKGGYEIKGYDVDIVVTENNVLKVTEKINVYFYESRHGIYRTIPLKGDVVRNDGTKGKFNASISNIKVSDDFTKSTTYGTDKSVELKIGNANSTIIGPHTYTIIYNYSLGDDGTDEYDELYYNIIGTNWDTTISNVTFSITMPKDFDTSMIGFTHGLEGATNTDSIFFDVDGNKITGLYSGTLNKYNGLTTRIELPEGYFEIIDYQKYIDFAVISIFIIFVIVTIILWITNGKDRPVVETVEFYPPEGLNSLELAFAYKTKAERKDVTSLLIYLANKGYIKIEESEKSIFSYNNFKIIKLKEYDGNNDAEMMFFNGLFKYSDIVTTTDLFDRFYKTQDRILNSINKKENRNKLINKKSKKNKKIATFLMIVVLIIMYFVLNMNCEEIFIPIFILPFILSSLFLFSSAINFFASKEIGGVIAGAIMSFMAFQFFTIPQVALFQSYIELTKNQFILLGAGAVSLVIMAIFTMIMTSRTEYGTMILGKIKGFKRFLETARKEELERLVIENPSYFYDILPYTYVLGVSNKWIKKFESINMKSPEWYDSPNTFSVVSFGNTINRTLNSTNIAMSTSPSSSGGSSGGYSGGSSGGSSGGGSSGGGSGGGGGGSW